MAKSSFQDMAIQCLRETPGCLLTAREIAEWIFSSYPDRCEQKRKDSLQNLSDDKALVRQLASEITARIKSGSHIKVIQKKHSVRNSNINYFYFSSDDDIQDTISGGKVSESEMVDKKEIREDVLYPLLKDYLKSELKVYSKHINEKQSSNRAGRGGNEWLFPDLVGMRILSKEWDNEIKTCVEQYDASKKIQLWSFEVKKDLTRGNIRASFFQAVSNSSWAHLGYLVARKIDEKATGELRILSSLHGIGFILLNTENTSKSQILIPAREKMNIDWDAANRIASENKGFKQYIKVIREFYQSGNEGHYFWNK